MPKIEMDPNDPIYARILENKFTISNSRRNRIMPKKSNSIHPLPITQNNGIDTIKTTTTRSMPAKR